jgi:DNA-binding IscR family transcriptional regulator
MSEVGRVLTSEMIAPMMGTNPVVVRRTMAGLRKAGIVHSEKGHGGGWSLTRELSDVTLGEVYDALGAPTLFGIGNRVESPGCVVEQAVNRALGKALADAEALLLKQLRGISLSDLAADIRRNSKRARKGESTHV